ncbi:unnamed protein product, partial [Meganyctiphanes norvegica]
MPPPPHPDPLPLFGHIRIQPFTGGGRNCVPFVATFQYSTPAGVLGQGPGRAASAAEYDGRSALGLSPTRLNALNHCSGEQSLAANGQLISSQGGEWKWLNGQPFPPDFPWSSGNPNNWEDQDCLHVNYNGGYDDVGCDYSIRYICEKSEV